MATETACFRTTVGPQPILSCAFCTLPSSNRCIRATVTAHWTQQSACGPSTTRVSRGPDSLPQFHPAGLQGAADPQGCIPDERGTDLPQALPGGLDLAYGCEPLRIVRGRLGRQLSGAVRVVVLQPPTHPPNPRVGRADTLWSEFAASSWSYTGWPTGTGGVHVGLLKDVVECAGLRPWFRDALTPGDVAVSTPHQCRLRVTLPTTIYPARN